MEQIWGVYKVEQVGDMDYIESETLIICFEKEQDAIAYRDARNHPSALSGEDSRLIIKPINLVKDGQYDPTNNYGLVNESVGNGFKCSCGHATLVPYANISTTQEEIVENGIAVGWRITLPFTCERCGLNQLAAEELLMYNSNDETVRCQIANLGHNLDNYVYDESSRVRQIVARKGVGHDVFIANPNEHPAVLREIAGQGKYLDVLKDHPDKSVSKLANKKLKPM